MEYFTLSERILVHFFKLSFKITLDQIVYEPVPSQKDLQGATGAVGATRVEGLKRSEGAKTSKNPRKSSKILLQQKIPKEDIELLNLADDSENPDLSDSPIDNQSFKDAKDKINDDADDADELIENLNQDQVFLKSKKKVFAEAERLAKDSGFEPFKESELDYLRREDTALGVE